MSLRLIPIPLQTHLSSSKRFFVEGMGVWEMMKTESVQLDNITTVRDGTAPDPRDDDAVPDAVVAPRDLHFRPSNVSSDSEQRSKSAASSATQSGVLNQSGSGRNFDRYSDHNPMEVDDDLNGRMSIPTPLDTNVAAHVQQGPGGDRDQSTYAKYASNPASPESSSTVTGTGRQSPPAALNASEKSRTSTPIPSAPVPCSEVGEGEGPTGSSRACNQIEEGDEGRLEGVGASDHKSSAAAAPKKKRKDKDGVGGSQKRKKKGGDKEGEGGKDKKKTREQRREEALSGVHPILRGYYVLKVMSHSLPATLRQYFQRPEKIGMTASEAILFGLLITGRLSWIFLPMWKEVLTSDSIQYRVLRKGPEYGAVKTLTSNPYKITRPSFLSAAQMKAITETALIILCKEAGILENKVHLHDGNETDVRKLVKQWIAWAVNVLGQPTGVVWSSDGFDLLHQGFIEERFQRAMRSSITWRERVRMRMRLVNSESVSDWIDYDLSNFNDICVAPEKWTAGFLELNRTNSYVQEHVVRQSVTYTILNVTDIAKKTGTGDYADKVPVYETLYCVEDLDLDSLA